MREPANLIPISDPADPRVAPFRDLKDPHLKDREGLFLAEGRLIVPLLLAPGRRFEPAAILGTPAALNATNLHAAPPACPVYQASQSVMDSIAGFHIHRGLIATAKRTPVPAAEDLLREHQPRLVVAVEDLTNHDNLGGVFRNAAAFAAGAVLTSPACCDPLYRKCVRVSMGHALRVPFATWPAAERGTRQLHALGYTTIALEPATNAQTLDQTLARLPADATIALILGHEGHGLSPGARHAAHANARIPMAPGTDSLNTATAAGIALHRAAEHLGILDTTPATVDR